MKSTPLKVRLLRKVVVDESTGCWNWTGWVSHEGYGMIRIGRGGDERGMGMVHRASYEVHVGPISEDMTVDHLCFNPSCVNPDHMRLLSNSENASNQRSAFKTHCKNGHEFTPENTYLRPVRKRGGKRDCHACRREQVARYRARKRAA